MKNTLIVELRTAKLDMLSVPELRAFFTEELENKTERIIVNLKNTEYIDSSALGYFFALHRELRSRNITLFLTSLQESVSRLFSINGADKFLQCRDTVEEILGPA